MAAKSGSREIEIKLAVPEAAATRRLLRRNGFRVVRRRVFEANLVFDTADRRLLARQHLLRLRQVGAECILTFKGAPAAGPHKSREELEITLSDPAAASVIFERLGFEPVFRYEKYRTEFAAADRQGLIMLDETPIGVWLELEGPPAWIDRTAAELGFHRRDYVTLSYGSLYRQFCEQHELTPGDMVLK